MRRIKTEIAVIGSGGTTIFAANRLLSLGHDVVLINPEDEFNFHDLRPYHGLGLWNAAYRSEDGAVSLSGLYETLLSRIREVFPAPIEQSGLTRREYWSVLSSTPVHRDITADLEREFFRLEKRPWSSGQFRLVNPEHITTRARRLGIDLTRVAQVEGGVVRSNALWWDAARVGLYLSQLLKTKFSGEGALPGFAGAKIEGRYGRKLVLSVGGEELSVEAGRAIFIFLTGEIFPFIKSIIAPCTESWIQGIRTRRKEQHFISFERVPNHDESGPPLTLPIDTEEPVWLELGSTRYHWTLNEGMATWQAGRGPDGLEHVLDEGMRFQSQQNTSTRFVRSLRGFKLDWDWKNPQWRETSHETYWATSFEGDLWNIMELLWNLPSP